jgi:thiol-disulfide isomerase/thioredoxin
MGELQKAGYPVVVNKWAAWCGPCRLEFPAFQRLSVELGKEVAFIGLNAQDNDAAAREFLAEHPVSYPSFADPDAKAARALGAGLSWPTTIFYDKTGERTYVKQGQYSDDARLRADVERYALGR